METEEQMPDDELESTPLSPEALPNAVALADAEDDETADVSGMKKAELQALARGKGLSDEGTKAELQARLGEADATYGEYFIGFWGIEPNYGCPELLPNGNACPFSTLGGTQEVADHRRARHIRMPEFPVGG